MIHPEMDDLLDLARDADPADGSIRQHVDQCLQCTEGMTRVARLDAAAEVIGPELGPRGLVSPATSVWERIQAEMASTGPVNAPRPQTLRRRRPPARTVAAAVVGLALGAVGGWVLADQGRSSEERPVVEARTPLATGTLSPVGQGAGSGQMTMSLLDGSQSLTISFSQDVAGPGYVEAWLLDPLTNEMLGLGVLPAGGGTVTVPLDADLSRFTTVDISREPFDGDPAHSDESIARGVLNQV